MDPNVPSGTCRGHPGHVSSQKNKWRTQEDFAMAYALQENEFVDHYSQNRQERRQVGVDVKKSKEEQELEDKFAEEYWEQVRLDREKEDERLARELQEELAKEEMESIRRSEEQDEELAKRVAKVEIGQAKFENERLQEMAADDERVAKDLEDYLKSTNDIPNGLSESDWSRLKVEKREGKRITLPPGITPEQQAAIEMALREEDSKLAQEVQDLELAKFLQRKEQKRLQKLKSREQMDNEMNQAFQPVQAVNVKPGKSTAREGNLIDLSDEDFPPPPPPIAGVNTNPFTGEKYHPTNPFLDAVVPPPRPPPPNLDRRGSGDKLSGRKSPTVNINWGDGRGEDKAEPSSSANASSGSDNQNTTTTTKSGASMGGVRVLPPVFRKSDAD